jgi:diaminopimelate epimerase
VAAALADAHGEDLIVGTGRRFWKMSGSGNDFVVFDVRKEAAGALERPEAMQELCARGTGIGADGVVFVGNAGRSGASLSMRYYNGDGSRVDFCGNATLCITRLASQLGIASAGGVAIETDSGVVPTRMAAGGPEIDLPAVTVVAASVDIELEAGEQRIGFALVGVPHLVVRCDDIETVDVGTRGRALRRSDFLAAGANVNFVSERENVWSIRTFERGVEGETLACGSGAIASAILLATWQRSGDETSLTTRSGRILRARLRRENDSWMPTLAGEGRLVFTGELV